MLEEMTIFTSLPSWSLVNHIEMIMLCLDLHNVPSKTNYKHFLFNPTGINALHFHIVVCLWFLLLLFIPANSCGASAGSSVLQIRCSILRETPPPTILSVAVVFEKQYRACTTNRNAFSRLNDPSTPALPGDGRTHRVCLTEHFQISFGEKINK